MKQGTLLGVLFAVSLLVMPAKAQDTGAFSFPNFSATTTMHVNGKTLHSKIARAGNKFRSDLPGSGGERYMLMLLDQNKTFMVMGPTMCMEMPHTGSLESPLAASAKDKTEVKVIGSGTMAGHPVRIEEVIVTPAGGGKAVTMKVWAATDLHGFPVRTQTHTAHGTVETDYTDISLSAPPDSLFAVPQNCRAMPMIPRGVPLR